VRFNWWLEGFCKNIFYVCSMRRAHSQKHFLESIFSVFYSYIDLYSCAMSSAIFILLLLSHFVLELKGFSSFLCAPISINTFLLILIRTRKSFLMLDFFGRCLSWKNILNYLHWYSGGALMQFRFWVWTKLWFLKKMYDGMEIMILWLKLKFCIIFLY
jgi:hypothetical protein